MRLDPHYARMLARTPVMPADEQRRLAERYARTRDPRDAQRLVLGNLRLVVKLARELGRRRPGEMMDLIQEGNAGLAYAVQRFDPQRGVKVASYAAWWIRAYILRYHMETSRVVHFASTREGRKRFFAGSLPGPDRSIDAPIRSRDGGPEHSLAGVLPGDDADRPDVQCETRDYQRRVRRAIADFRPKLDKRARTIFDARLLREDPLRLVDVGRRLSLSGERTRQIEAEILDDLRGHVASALQEPEREPERIAA